MSAYLLAYLLTYLLIYLLTYLFTYLLTYSMVQSPSWEANWFATSQEIPRISRNPKVHYRTHKRPPLVSILGQPNPVHIPTSYFLEFHPNIVHPSTPRSPQWSPSLRFPHQDPIHPLSSPILATCPTYLILHECWHLLLPCVRKNYKFMWLISVHCHQVRFPILVTKLWGPLLMCLVTRC